MASCVVIYSRVVLVQSYHCHLKTTWGLEHIRQAQETSIRKRWSGNHWQWYTHWLLVHWCRNRVVVKSQPCHCVCRSRLLSNLVTYLQHMYVAIMICIMSYPTGHIATIVCLNPELKYFLAWWLGRLISRLCIFNIAGHWLYFSGIFSRCSLISENSTVML